MRISPLALLLLAGFVAGATPARADYLTVGAGYFNVFDNVDNSTWFEAEYRGNYVWDKFLPIIGIGTDTDGALYGYAGVNYDWNIAPHWYFIPSVAFGAYDKADSKNLRGAREFRPSVETDYQFDSGWRSGIALHHISNARLYNKDPGVEILEATVSIPLANIFGH